MASNSFGDIFRITTFGESHGPLIGVVIDGCPSNLPISIEEIQKELACRQPGKSPFTSPRKEPDKAEIVSGIFEGKTTGAPITILIRNQDADSSSYEEIKNLYRPGHANFTYLEKYGIFDYRGGGRASARETVARVAAGAIAKKLLSLSDIYCTAYISELGSIEIEEPSPESLREKTHASPLFCPDPIASEKMMGKILEAKNEGDSLGAIVGCYAQIPSGLGDPIYQKLEANLASAMLSIPASKGFEIGAGFKAARMRGSEHNDPFEIDNGRVKTSTNFAGGTLGGISNGAPLYFRVPFKPTSSIRISQKTVDLSMNETHFTLPQNSRHDPCVAIRAVAVVEAMCALVIADALIKKCLSFTKTLQNL
jgi:chorismate synthase